MEGLSQLQLNQKQRNATKLKKQLPPPVTQPIRQEGINATNEYGETSLHLAAKKGNATDVKFLIKSGANVNAKSTRNGFTALHYAAGCGHRETVELLLQHDADVSVADKEGKTPWDHANRMGHKEIATLLNKTALNTIPPPVLLKPSNPNPGIKMDELHEFIQTGDLGKIKNHVHRGNVNTKDTSDLTLLHYAAMYGKKDIAAFLMKMGAKMDARDNQDKSAESYASENGHNEIILLFLNMRLQMKALDDIPPPKTNNVFRG